MTASKESLGKAWQDGDETNSILMVECAEVLAAFFRAFKKKSKVPIVCPLSTEDQFDELERLPWYTMLEAMTFQPSGDLSVTFRVQMGVVIRGDHDAPEGFAIDLEVSASSAEPRANIEKAWKSRGALKAADAESPAPVASPPPPPAGAAAPAEGVALATVDPAGPQALLPANPPASKKAADDPGAVVPPAQGAQDASATKYTQASVRVLLDDPALVRSIAFPMLSEAQQWRLRTMKARLEANEPDGLFDQVDSHIAVEREAAAIRLSALEMELKALAPGSILVLDVFPLASSMNSGAPIARPSATRHPPFSDLLVEIGKWSADEAKSTATKASMVAAASEGAKEAVAMVQTTVDSVRNLEALAKTTLVNVQEQLASGTLKRRWNKLDRRLVGQNNQTLFTDRFGEQLDLSALASMFTRS